jgi:hypothetical protein
MTSKVHYKRMIFSDLKSDLHVKCPDYHKSIWVKNINAVRPKHDKKKQLAVGNKWVKNNFCILELSHHWDTKIVVQQKYHIKSNSFVEQYPSSLYWPPD